MEDPATPPPRRLLDQVRDRIRVRHYSIRTEQVYLDWIRRFIRFHGKRHPSTMQKSLAYDDVVADVAAFLAERAAACVAAGIGRDRIVLDPGFGFGKTVEHNLALLRRLAEIAALGYPLLAGLSRKSTIGILTGRDVDDRMAGSVAAALAAIARGASIVRVHDVRETVDALKVWRAVQVE